MTDIKIIKDLQEMVEYLKNMVYESGTERAGYVKYSTLKNILDLINRQQAEIERLKIENQSLRGAANSYKLHYNEARTEVAKEFAERLKDRIVNFPSMYPIESATLAFLNGISHRQLEILEIIDDIVKEMAGDIE